MSAINGEQSEELCAHFAGAGGLGAAGFVLYALQVLSLLLGLRLHQLLRQLINLLAHDLQLTNTQRVPGRQCTVQQWESKSFSSFSYIRPIMKHVTHASRVSLYLFI